MRVDRNDERYKYKRTLKALYGVIVCFFILIFIFLIEMVWKNGNNGEFMALCISMVLIIYAGILLNRMLEKGNEIQIENSSNYIKEYDEKMKQTYMDIRRNKQAISYMRHDMANHIQVINAICEQHGSKYPGEEIEDIKNKLEEMSYIKYCDNVMLDILLEQRIRDMQDRGIRVDADIKLIGFDNVDVEQLCAVLGAIIDNVSRGLSQGKSVHINIHNYADTRTGKIIAWKLEADKRDAGSEGEELHKENIKKLHFLINRMNGSLMTQSTDTKIMETGMLEVGINAEK